MNNVVFAIIFFYFSISKGDYSKFTKWYSDLDMITQQNCFAVNFGFEAELPIPQIRMSLDDRQPSIDKFGFDKLYKCYFVFIGDKYVNVLEDVVSQVMEISKKLDDKRPGPFFLMGKYDTKSLNEYSTPLQNVTVVSDF